MVVCRLDRRFLCQFCCTWTRLWLYRQYSCWPCRCVYRRVLSQLFTYSGGLSFLGQSTSCLYRCLPFCGHLSTSFRRATLTTAHACCNGSHGYALSLPKTAEQRKHG